MDSVTGVVSGHPALLTALDGYIPRSDREEADVRRIRDLSRHSDPWSRHSRLHITGSALVVHPSSSHVLMRWHERVGHWLQVGGHANDGERDPWDVALREAREETGLDDLRGWPTGSARAPVQVTIVGVPAGSDEPAHEHADIRYVLATEASSTVVPESRKAPLRWSSVADAISSTDEDSLREFLRRVDALIGR